MGRSGLKWVEMGWIMLCLLLGRPGTQGALSSPALGERSNLAARNDPWPSLCFSNFSIAHFCKRTSCKLKTTVGPFNAFQCLSMPFIHQSCSFFIPLTLQNCKPWIRRGYSGGLPHGRVQQRSAAGHRGCQWATRMGWNMMKHGTWIWHVWHMTLWYTMIHYDTLWYIMIH